MGSAQIIMVVLLSLNLLAAANLHGKTKVGKHSFWEAIINVSITVGVLLWGGFFS